MIYDAATGSLAINVDGAVDKTFDGTPNAGFDATPQDLLVGPAATSVKPPPKHRVWDGRCCATSRCWAVFSRPYASVMRRDNPGFRQQSTRRIGLAQADEERVSRSGACTIR